MKTLFLVITQFLAIKDYYQVDQLKGQGPKRKKLAQQAENSRSVLNTWLRSYDVWHGTHIHDFNAINTTIHVSFLAALHVTMSKCLENILKKK